MAASWYKFFTPEALDLLDRDIAIALDEDGPDWTSRAIFPSGKILTGSLVAKEKTHVAGLPIIGIVMKKLGQPFAWCPLAKEGSIVEKGATVAKIEAPAAAFLEGERIILNFITHMCGVANLTAKYVERLSGSNVKLLDTRKTLPGLRWPEKYAVQLAGGMNHRMNLRQMLMLKDNHIDAAGSITRAVEKLRQEYGSLPGGCPPIEVECRTREDVAESLRAGVERIMLDNMRGQTLIESLAMIPEEVEAEISGGVTLENIRELAFVQPRSPDFISVGRLTHSAPAADFSMRLNEVSK